MDEIYISELDEVFISELDEYGRVPLWKIPECKLRKDDVFG